MMDVPLAPCSVFEGVVREAESRQRLALINVPNPTSPTGVSCGRTHVITEQQPATIRYPRP
jgi:hypothetical protein